MKKRLALLILWLVAAMHSAAAQKADVYFSDTFASGNKERPRGWEFSTTDATFWQVRDGWLWTGNGDDLISPDGYSFAVVNAPGAANWTDYRVSCRFYMKQTNGQVLLVARWANSQNYYRAALEVYEGRRLLRLSRVVRGRAKELGSQVVELDKLGLTALEQGSADKAVEFFLSVSANRVTAGVAGKTLVEARDTELGAGTAGVGQRYNEVYFDDVIVTADPAKDVAIRSVYHVEVAKDVSLSRGAEIQKQLTDKGLGPVFLRGAGDRVSVQQGNYLSQSEAEQALARVQSNGFSPVGVVGEQRGEAAATAGKDGEVYSVLLAETSDAAEAQALVAALRRQAYFPFVDSRDGTRRVLIGRFATSDEAERMRAQMAAGEGFAFARVVNLSKIGAPAETTGGKPGTATAAQPVPAAVRKTVEWQSLSPTQRDKVIEAVMMQRASRMQLQSVEEIGRLKKMVESLNKKQVEILNKITSAEQAEEEKRRAVSRLTMAINRAQDQRDWAGMKDLIDKLEQVDPNSPLAAMKRNRLTHLVNNTWDGQEIYRQSQEKRARELRGKAQQRMDSGRLQEAMQIWHGILSMDIADEDLKKEAAQKIEEINTLLDSERKAREKEMAKERRLLFMLVGAVGVFFLFILIVGYFIGRHRYNRMATQLREEAIAPLQALQEKTSVLGAGGGAGLSYTQGDQALIEQAEAPDAEFMIAETEEPAEEPEVEIEPIATEEPIAEIEPEPAEAPVAIPMPDFDDSEPEEIAPVEAPAPQPVAAEESGEDFVFSFDDSESDTQGGSSVLPEEPSSPPEDEEDIVLSFEDALTPGPAETPAETTGEAVTATEVSGAAAPEPKVDDEEIVFSFDDAVIEEPESQPSAAETIIDESPQKGEDSLYESIPLEDLSLDLGDEEPKADQTAPMAAPSAPSESNVSDSFDLDLDLPDLDDVTEEAPAISVPAAGGGETFVQDLDAQSVGEAPEGWNVESVTYASLEVVEDPDGSGGKCIKFSKSAGEGPTAFRRTFPDATGKVRIEYDIRCDEKNKHLLGFYAEQDNDFRRSVHTVVQCTDPLRPAHLRIFTRPTSYELGTWRHVRYVIDLDEGLVDGYVDDELIAEGVRMGTKADCLNTLSVRDDSESTGILFIRNLVVGSA